MGKSLKGRECGKGICQRKDGLYSARFVDRTGTRHGKNFKTLPEAKNWMEEVRYADKHGGVFAATTTTVDAWFNFWIENIVGDLAPNTLRNYRDRYQRNIKPVIGHMCLADVKPMHCKRVLLLMDAEYSGSSIKQTYITMGTLFKSAEMNDLITKPPMDGVRYTKPCRAVEILEECWNEREGKEFSPLLSQRLEYLDRRRGTAAHMFLQDLVFINWRTGEPAKNSSYDTHLYRLCDDAGIAHLCMHALRHTYAMRAIESGMQPKILQKLLGPRQHPNDHGPLRPRHHGVAGRGAAAI